MKSIFVLLITLACLSAAAQQEPKPQPVKCAVVEVGERVTVRCPDVQFSFPEWPDVWVGPHTAGSVYRLVDHGTRLEFVPSAAYCTREFKKSARRAERDTPHARISFQNLVPKGCEPLIRARAHGDEEDLFSDDEN